MTQDLSVSRSVATADSSSAKASQPSDTAYKSGREVDSSAAANAAAEDAAENRREIEEDLVVRMVRSGDNRPVEEIREEFRLKTTEYSQGGAAGAVLARNEMLNNALRNQFNIPLDAKLPPPHVTQLVIESLDEVNDKTSVTKTETWNTVRTRGRGAAVVDSMIDSKLLPPGVVDRSTDLQPGQSQGATAQELLDRAAQISDRLGDFTDIKEWQSDTTVTTSNGRQLDGSLPGLPVDGTDGSGIPGMPGRNPGGLPLGSGTTSDGDGGGGAGASGDFGAGEGGGARVVGDAPESPIQFGGGTGSGSSSSGSSTNNGDNSPGGGAGAGGGTGSGPQGGGGTDPGSQGGGGDTGGGAPANDNTPSNPEGEAGGGGENPSGGTVISIEVTHNADGSYDANYSTTDANGNTHYATEHFSDKDGDGTYEGDMNGSSDGKPAEGSYSTTVEDEENEAHWTGGGSSDESYSSDDDDTSTSTATTEDYLPPGEGRTVIIDAATTAELYNGRATSVRDAATQSTGSPNTTPTQESYLNSGNLIDPSNRAPVLPAPDGKSKPTGPASPRVDYNKGNGAGAVDPVKD